PPTSHRWASRLRHVHQVLNVEDAGRPELDPALRRTGTRLLRRLSHHDRPNAGEVEAPQEGVDRELTRSAELEQEAGCPIGDLPYLARELVGPVAHVLGGLTGEQRKTPEREGPEEGVHGGA